MVKACTFWQIKLLFDQYGIRHILFFEWRGYKMDQLNAQLHITVKYHIFKVLQKSVLCNLLKQTSVLKVSEIQDKYFQFARSKCRKTNSFQDHREKQFTLKSTNLTPSPFPNNSAHWQEFVHGVMSMYVTLESISNYLTTCRHKIQTLHWQMANS